MSFHSISSLPPEDQALFNQFGRGPTVPIPYRSIPEAFEAIVSSHPSATAVRECFGPERVVTYADLEWRSNIVANTLKETYGVGRGQRVVCVFSRCIEMCAIILGVLKVGAQYVPIDGAVMVEESLRQYVSDLTPPLPPLSLCRSALRKMDDVHETKELMIADKHTKRDFGFRCPGRGVPIEVQG